MHDHEHTQKAKVRLVRWLFATLGALPHLASAQGGSLGQASKTVNRTDSSDPRLQQYEKPGVRFDMLVREDFFAGMFGDEARLERGMSFCEKVLAKHPRHAEALVWHGGGLLSLSALAYKKGDSALGDHLFQRGLKEMDDARSFEPQNMGVKIGRAATLIGISQSGYDPSDQQGRQLLESAALDYEKVLAWQQPQWASLAMHNKGELLFGLASAWSLLGNQPKTRLYLQRILADCKGSVYEQEARSWLQQKPVPLVRRLQL